ncbi:MAG: NitT/TauT family transport system ATP-binding protein [Acidobacteriota bacterium]|jgi:NitT/TauT family transport system ATP-binding protein|nr:NitT/TauT family transport system ATP-binding protein [Acidobacteriota bacterium]
MSFALDAITKEYGSGPARTTALAGVSLAARGAEFLSIVGPSGCGKTTLLKIVAGLTAPSSGRVTFDDHPPGKLRTALVFQDHGLLPWYDVLQNVALGLRFQPVDREVALERARQFIVQVGLEKFLHHKPHQLSIGMRQRVGIGRAFVADPQILLLDEPFGSLDAQTRIVLQQELLRIWQEHRKTVVHVTHDVDEAILLSDRIAVMSGRPARIREEIDVPFARPRDLDILATPEAREIRRRVWQILEEEVRESLCVPR